MKLSKQLILASNSPRRKEILSQAGFEFIVKVKPTDEIFPDDIPIDEVPIFLAKQKAQCFENECNDQLILCADTVVIVDNEILNKPVDVVDAQKMLRKLSNKTHRVVTGVCLMSSEKTELFSDTTWVHFKGLSEWEIDYYIAQCRPFDKAGSYGVQDFIGMIGIDRIEGSFYTVMGLPIHLVYAKLKSYLLP